MCRAEKQKLKLYHFYFTRPARTPGSRSAIIFFCSLANWLSLQKESRKVPKKGFCNENWQKVVLTGGHLYIQAPNFKIKMLEKNMAK